MACCSPDEGWAHVSIVAIKSTEQLFPDACTADVASLVSSHMYLLACSDLAERTGECARHETV